MAGSDAAARRCLETHFSVGRRSARGGGGVSAGVFHTRLPGVRELTRGMVISRQSREKEKKETKEKRLLSGQKVTTPSGQTFLSREVGWLTAQFAELLQSVTYFLWTVSAILLFSSSSIVCKYFNDLDQVQCFTS
ncbi:uncharacterized protein LOC111553152 [Piliocolobus tephrosceles]|uniref:uncharacterized protein LOC111553152 n=1 Tax=Piliocolobus tephrosceles TaxID=591936 RepID=UPI000C29DBE1|nr:uncharacterized protein LOC111553152 [Piliocolobus tephrosceles]